MTSNFIIWKTVKIIFEFWPVKTWLKKSVYDIHKTSVNLLVVSCVCLTVSSSSAEVVTSRGSISITEAVSAGCYHCLLAESKYYIFKGTLSK